MTATATIERIQKHAEMLRESVRPGQPFRFSEASTPNDCVWQGDLGLVIIDRIPTGYCRVDNPTDKDRQLVIGNTQGARHCLDSLTGVVLYHPRKWDADSLIGPCFTLTEERTVQHPTHGPVTIPAGFSVQAIYQREWDKEQRKARRSRD